MDLDYRILLEKYKRKECSPKEIQRLQEWFSDESHEKSVKQMLMEDLDGFEVNEINKKEVDFDKIFTSIESKIPAGKQSTKTKSVSNNIVWRVLKVAAILLLFFAGGGILSYTIFHQPPKVDETYSEIKAPRGATSEISLPDGSHVWLNAGSRIKYVNDFNKTNRNVTLEGEAYFKVAKNKHLPFIVITSDLNIRAVGTEFNVKAYKDEGIIETTLVEGKVTISNGAGTQSQSSQQVFLKPRQKAVYLKNQEVLNVADIKTIRKLSPEIKKPIKGTVYVADKIDPTPITAWRENKNIFRGEEMSALAILLERKYNVFITFASENIKQYRFTGTLEDETLTQVLDVIKLTAPIDYTIEGKEVKIFENLQMKQKFSSHLKKNK